MHQDEERLLHGLEERLGVRFGDRALLLEAVTHKSFLNEAGGPARSYDRLHLLGAAVFRLLGIEFLLVEHPDEPAAVIGKRHGGFLAAQCLVPLAETLQLHVVVRCGKGQRECDGISDTILAESAAAVLGAVYLDQGIDACNALLDGLFKDMERSGVGADPKTALQELLQARGLHPDYRVESKTGPDHASHWEVGVYVGEVRIGVGSADRSRKLAEKAAAAQALESSSQWLARLRR